MKTITSRSNPLIKQITELHSSKGRTRYNQFIAQGEKVCASLLENQFKICQIFAIQEQLPKAQELIDENYITLVSHSVMEKISTTVTPSGILATFEIPTPIPLTKLESGIVLAQIQDPGNMGTLLRTAAALLVKNVIIIEGADIWNPKVIQASAGTIGRVPFFQTSWQECIALKKDIKLCALVVKDGKHPKEISQSNILLIIGNEAQGIPKGWYPQMDYFMTIPMPGSIESLNAAIAGSIAMYITFSS